MKRQITIGEIAEINANSLTQKDMFQEIMYLDTGNITRNEIDNIQVLNVMMDKIPSRAKRKVKDKTIIYSTVRPNQEHYGFLENPGDNFIISTGFSTIDVYDENTDEKFIYYLLTQKHITDYLHTIGENSVSSYPSINPDDIANLKFAVPDLKTQQSIAAVLSALDKKIALNKQINARLEEMAKTLYDYWFVQFDFPDTDGKPYKSSGGEMVFDETLKREIPKGWEVKKLKDAMQIVRGASPRPIDDFLSDNGIPWIKISDATATSTPFIFKTKEFIKSNGKQYSRYLYPNTLILSNSATPGIPRIVELECCVHDGWLIIENLKNSLFNEFMYFYFLNFKEKIMNLGSGSIFKNLKTEYIKELDLIIPNKETLENAKTIFSDVFKKIKNTQKQNHHLIQLRDFLLPMLMNGQVSVAE
jgi:type I restriction modification DNA specificity family protein